MNSTNLAPQRLHCLVQNYDWGKVGKESTVYQLLKPSVCLELDKSLPYAELWMGTHPNAPSVLVESGVSKVTLKEFISANPKLYLGQNVLSQFGPDLPFLFKVLSVSKALSIQAHPDKTLAQKLFQNFPDIYKDPNHKPEMTIALTKFEALCGFRSLNEIDKFLKDVPELSKLLGDQECQNFLKRLGGPKVCLKNLFSLLIKSSPKDVENQLSSLISRIVQFPDALSHELVQLIQRLNTQFPNDVGVFCVFFLNYLILEPSQAVFLGANEPHAYISGDCIECMATSDNVVRAGLTPKFRDVDILVDMLTYESRLVSDQLMSGIPVPNHPHSLLYNPPIPEFSVVTISLSTPNTQESCGEARGPGLLLITESTPNSQLIVGTTSLPLLKGAVYFVPPQIAFTLQTPEAVTSSLKAYFAFCESNL